MTTKTFHKGKARLCATSAITTLMISFAASAVQAQDAAPTAEVEENVIIVTGSRIARPNVDSPIPVTSVSAADLTRTGQTSIGDVLNDLPQLRSTWSQGNSTAFIGTAGFNFLDLRGIGETRTLVLVNGRRHVTGLEGEFLVDTNTIPDDLIDRVDIVTGGSSAVYGSDANAGVVNFVLKRDFEGLAANAQGGVTSYGGRGSYRLSGTWGKNFSEGRGNIAVSAIYDRDRPLYYTSRPKLTGAYAGRRQIQLVDDPSEDNTIPDRQFLTGIHSFGFSNGGSFISYSGSSIRGCPDDIADACLPNGFPRVFLFQPDGALTESNYGVDFRPVGSGNNQGGDGSTLNDTGMLQPGLKRYIFNVLGHYDFSDAFKPYFEAKFVRVKAQQISSPTFAQGGDQGLVGGDPAEFYNDLTSIPINLDNPFLTDQARTLITSLLPAGSTFFRLNRNNVDLGSRGELNRRDTYRFVVGAEGTFNDDWQYDVSVNYGKLKTRNLSTNNRIEQNFYNAIDAVRNGAGEIVCRVNEVTITDPGCVPLNILGNGRASRAALDYINTTSVRTGRASQFVVDASVTGDLSQLFELPGGPIRFAFGAEYRREKAYYAYDDLVESGATFLNAIQPFNPPTFVVKEAFGEVQIPLLKDVAFADELSLNGAARVAKYKGSIGTVWAYNYGGVYAPISDIRFRANYSKSVRAPTLANSYETPSQNFANVDDPCDVNFIDAGTATRAANCAAAGVPDGFENFVTRAETLEILSGGNPNLEAEKSRSWTYGFVTQPRFVPGLTISVDYYDIKIDNVISSVDAQDILNGCYDAADLNNAFCELISARNPDSTFATPALLQSSLNFSKLIAKGIDLDVAYSRKFDGDNQLQLRFIGNWVRTRTDYPYISEPDRPERIKGELGDPIYSFNASADFTHRNVTFGYTMRYIGKQSITDWEAQHTTYGVEPLDPFYADFVYYPSVTYHDIRMSVKLDGGFEFYGGVDNVANKKPPFGILGVGALSTGDAIYDNIGRFLYAGVRLKI